MDGENLSGKLSGPCGISSMVLFPPMVQRATTNGERGETAEPRGRARRKPEPGVTTVTQEDQRHPEL